MSYNDAQPIASDEEAFWSQFWAEHISSVSDVFVMLPASEVRCSLFKALFIIQSRFSYLKSFRLDLSVCIV